MNKFAEILDGYFINHCVTRDDIVCDKCPNAFTSRDGYEWCMLGFISGVLKGEKDWKYEFFED